MANIVPYFRDKIEGRRHIVSIFPRQKKVSYSFVPQHGYLVNTTGFRSQSRFLLICLIVVINFWAHKSIAEHRIMSFFTEN